MASTNKTEYLSLNAWVESDRPQRADFNSDNSIIDSALGAHLENDDLHLTSTEKARISRPFTVVSYVGTGAASLKVTLPLVAQAVLVYREDMPFTVYDSTSGINKVYAAVSFSGGGATAGLTLSGNGYITVTQSTSAVNGIMHCLNESGGQYKVIAFR